MRRWVSPPSPERYVERWEVVEQVGEDSIYRKTGGSLDLLRTAIKEARHREDVDQETQNALHMAELALDRALECRSGTVAEQVHEDLDLDADGATQEQVEEAVPEVDL